MLALTSYDASISENEVATHGMLNLTAVPIRF